MKKLLLLFCLVLSVSSVLFAQKGKPRDPNFTNFYRDIPAINTDAVTITFEDVVSKMAYCKLKIRIKNKTTDYIMFKPSESIFKLPQGEFPCSDKMIIIPPLESDYKVLDIKGDGKCLVDSFALIIKGIYRFSSTEEVQIAPNFNLPPSANTFNAGDFQCTMINIKKETAETFVRYDCKYTGKNAGIIDPNKAVVRLENGQEYANGKSTAKQSVLFNGENDKFNLYFYVPGRVADMQFANMQVVWKNTFLDSEITLLAPQKAYFVIDPGKTEGKNKR